jgi:hypothetical protein
MSNAIHRIDIEPFGLGQRGQIYRVHYAGIVLVESSRNPEFDACRALLAKGLVGYVEVWRVGSSFSAMRLEIQTAAGLTVEEGDREGLRFVRWRPRADDSVPDVVSCRADGSRTGSEEPDRRDLAKNSSPPTDL